MLCKANPEWFTKAAQGDMKYMQKHIKNKQHSADPRATVQEQHIYGGFAAIHYSAYHGYVDLFKFLFPFEGWAVTQQEVSIPAPAFSTQTRYRLSAGSNAIAIAVLTGQDQVVQEALALLSVHGNLVDEICGRINDIGITTYVTASLCRSQGAMMILENKLFVDKEIGLVLRGDVTPIMNAAYFGNKQTIQILYDLSKKQPYTEIIYEMALNRDTSGKTAIEVSVDTNIDFYKFNTSQSDKQDTNKIIYTLVKEAYIYSMKQTQDKWEQLRSRFLNGQTENDIFGATITGL